MCRPDPWEPGEYTSWRRLGTASRAPEVRVKADPAEVLLIVPHEHQGATSQSDAGAVDG